MYILLSICFIYNIYTLFMLLYIFYILHKTNYNLIFCASFSCNSMPCNGCLALHGVNPN